MCCLHTSHSSSRKKYIRFLRGSKKTGGYRRMSRVCSLETSGVICVWTEPGPPDSHSGWRVMEKQVFPPTCLTAFPLRYFSSTTVYRLCFFFHLQWLTFPSGFPLPLTANEQHELFFPPVKHGPLWDPLLYMMADENQSNTHVMHGLILTPLQFLSNVNIQQQSVCQRGTVSSASLINV